MTDIRGNLSFNDAVIAKIVGVTVRKHNSVLDVNSGFFSKFGSNPANGVNVEVGQKEVAADLKLTVDYGKHVPTIFEALKRDIAAEVKRMTGLQLVELNVEVTDLVTEEEANALTLTDKAKNLAQVTGDAISNGASNVKDATAQGVESLKTEPRVK